MFMEMADVGNGRTEHMYDEVLIKTFEAGQCGRKMIMLTSLTTLGKRWQPELPLLIHVG